MSGWDVINLLATQFWQLAILAFAVWLIVRTLGRDRPHLAHALWALVLLKAVTPPVWSTPWSPFSRLMNWSTYGWGSTLQDGETVSMFQRFVLEPEVIAEATNAKSSPGNLTDVAVLANATGADWTSFDLWFILCALWLCGVAVALLLLCVRYLHVILQVRSATALETRELEKHMAELKKKLGIRRQVRLKVLDAPLGPAVIGLVRPTILLPALIVQGKSVDQITPLLAHELVHIRRGDLWWAVLQVMSRCIFWFHPAVRWADSQLSQEAERCCDEETIRSLNLSPVAYARCLLEVLEQKHRLHVAPALPGVRPVDITKDRLERVMKTRKSRYRRPPVWGWLVLVVGCVLTLPGAASVGISQDGPPNEKETAFVISFCIIETTRDSMQADEMWRKFDWAVADFEATGFRETFLEETHESGSHTEDFHPVQLARFEEFDSALLQQKHPASGEILAKPQNKFVMRPTMITLLNRTAEVISGGEIPVVGINKEIQTRTFGMKLKTTPTKVENQNVTLDLSIELSKLRKLQPVNKQAEGVELNGIRLETLQEMKLGGAIALAVPQPDRDNQPMVIVVQCSIPEAAPANAKVFPNPQKSVPGPPTAFLKSE